MYPATSIFICLNSSGGARQHSAARRIVLVLLLILGFSASVLQAQVTVATGSYLVNMGITPQTVNNGLKPYGLVYDLVVNYDVPVIWSINPSKAKDGIDFSHNGTDHRGGTFIVPAPYITPVVAARIAYWNGQGVQGQYAVSDVNVPFYDTITSFPRMMLDTLSGNQAILETYYNNAGIPPSSYDKGAPSGLTACYDLWANPHADPNWASHGYLYNFVTLHRGHIWSQCHTVSMMEACRNSVAPFQQLNFLTSSGLRCYNGVKCGLITETHTGNPTLPGTYHYPSDPMMQFMGSMDAATQKGSEKWFQPLSTGQWNNTTKRLVTTSNGVSPREGVIAVYGPAYGISSYGAVMYQGGHDLNDNGTTAEKVAAQRAYFNFLLYTGGKKKLDVSVAFPMGMSSGSSFPMTATVNFGTPPYTYAWSSQNGGTFNNPGGASTNYIAPLFDRDTFDVIRLVVSDACGRVNFRTAYITINPSIVLPISLVSFGAEAVDNRFIRCTWATASEQNNDFFTVERSPDAARFYAAGQVNGAGQSSGLIHYAFNDETPYTGISYYRLKQTDFNGQSSYSQTVSVRLGKSAFRVYPNPVFSGEALTVSRQGAGVKEIQAQLFDMSGRRVYKHSLAYSEGQESITFSLEALPAGLYTLTLSADTFFEKQSLIIQ